MDLSGVRILVADDNRYARIITRTLLGAYGLRHITEVEDGPSAIEHCKVRTPDVAIIDWYMPIFDGIEFTRWVRTSKDSPNLFMPVIMLSAHSEKGKVLSAMRTGVHSFVRKPVSASQLYAHLQKAIVRPPMFLRGGGYFGPAHPMMLEKSGDDAELIQLREHSDESNGDAGNPQPTAMVIEDG